MDTPTKFCQPGFFGGRNAQRQRRSQRLNRLFYPGFEHLNGCAAGFETTLIEHNPIAFGHDVSFDWALKFTDISINCCNHAGHTQKPRLRVYDCYRDSTAAVQSIPATGGRTEMSPSTYKHEADWCYRRSDGWPILSLDLPPKGACPCLDACSRDRAAVSFVTAQTERERLVHPRGRRLASLFYRLPPFRKGHRQMGHPSFICDLGMQPCARE